VVDKLEKDRLKVVIRDRIDELALLLQPLDQERVKDDEAGRMEQLISAGMDSAVSSSALRNLRLLNENLDWLDSDDGGYCEACGREIASARLLALPTTRLCVECAGSREKNL